MSSDVVIIANKSYNIKQSISDSSRRRRYFSTLGTEGMYTLTEDEQRLLTDLGINDTMMMNLKLYMPTFFDNLHMCKSDTNLILRKECNVPYYVLWSIMFANKQITDERIRKNKLAHKTHRNINVATHTALLSQMRPSDIHDPYSKLFQLILTSPTPTPTSASIVSSAEEPLFKLPTSPNDILTNVNIEYAKYIPNIFTLILTTSSSPRFTFTQRGDTCASDTLFSILLMADGLKEYFTKNISESDHNLETLRLAQERFKEMQKLEASGSSGPSGRRYSINETEGRGKQIRTLIGTCMKSGITMAELQNVVNKLIEGVKAPVRVHVGDKYKKISNVQGILFAGNSGKGLGHIIGILKIDNKWWISDNEVGYLHLITDNTFVTTLLEMLTTKTYKPDDVVFTFNSFINNSFTADNLLYQFIIDSLKYPNITKEEDIFVKYNVKANRILVFEV